jgi:hypothetical protein
VTIRTRREFLKIAGSASAAAFVGTGPVHAKALATNPNVYEAYDAGMVTGSNPNDRFAVVESVVTTAVNSIIRKMAGDEPDLATAWQTVLPGLSSSSTVAIKLNLLHNYNGPQFATLKAVVQGLKLVTSGTISVFDNDWGGVTNKVASHYSAFDVAGLGISRDNNTYTSPTVAVSGGGGLYVSTPLANADFGISLLATRPHTWDGAGVGNLSGVIKNMMGAVSKYTNTYGANGDTGARFHGNTQAFVDLFSNCMSSHLDLYIADHILVPKSEADNYYSVIGKRIVIGTDPAAVDSRSVDIINTIGANTVRSPSKLVPQALANGGQGTTSYNVVNCPVVEGPIPVSRKDVQEAIKNHKAGSAGDAAVQTVIDDYVNERDSQ